MKMTPRSPKTENNMPPNLVEMINILDGSSAPVDFHCSVIIQNVLGKISINNPNSKFKILKNTINRPSFPLFDNVSRYCISDTEMSKII